MTVLLERAAADAPPSLAAAGAVPLRRRAFLDRPTFARRHAVREEALGRLREHVGAHGVRVATVERERRAVRLEGTAAAMEACFGVALRHVALGEGTYRVPDGPARLPSDLAPSVQGVFGLDSRPRLRAHFRRNADPSARGYAATAVGSAYDFPTGVDGTGCTIALLEFGGGYAPADLARFFEGEGIAAPSVTAVGLDGASNAPTGDPNGPDAEVELDVELAGALAPGAAVVVYFAPNTEQGFVDALTSAVHDRAHAPGIVSISWGGPEASWSTSARSALEGAAQDGAALGVTIVAASGDQGASDGEPSGTLAVDFPASSPYVLGCGGTRLVLSGTTIASEVAWNDLSEGEGATGGGVSEEFPLPSYQEAAKVPPAPDGVVGRGVPDVAADADPVTGYAVVVDGDGADIGGTSAAAPLWAALLARCAQGLGQPLGYLNPRLYTATFASAFRPITQGSNGGYSAGPGWNPCTGLGSPRGSSLLAALDADGAGERTSGHRE